MNSPARTALVTGATSGIGLATAASLADAGFCVLLGARTATDADRAASAIMRTVPDARLEPAIGDLSLMREVRTLAEQIVNRHEGLDVVVLNAGIVLPGERLTEEGFPVMLATNYLGQYLFAHLVLTRLKATPAARLVSVSSSAHRRVRSLSPDLFDAREPPTVGYETTKLLEMFLIRGLARRVAVDDLTIFGADPGFVRTQLGRHTRGLFRLFLNATRPIQAPADKAATRITEPILLADPRALHGQLVKGARIQRSSALLDDPQVLDRIRNSTAAMLTHRGLAADDELRT